MNLLMKRASQENRRKRLFSKTEKVELTVEKQKKVLRAVTIIRNRRRYSETANESLARRYVANEIVLFKLKKLLGKNLKAVVIVGSAQIGVSKSTLKYTSPNTPSDLDMLAIIDPKLLSMNEKYEFKTSVEKFQEWRRIIEEKNLLITKIVKKFGFKLQLMFYLSEPLPYAGVGQVFVTSESSIGAAFQPIYGLSWIHNKLPREFLQSKLPQLVSKQRNLPKYQSR
ncbi:MAG: hypothetical protein WCI04_00715 [archaeon]